MKAFEVFISRRGRATFRGGFLWFFSGPNALGFFLLIHTDS